VKLKVILSPDSLDDLFEIYKFVFFNDSKSAAINLTEKLQTKCFELEHFAERGHKIPELDNFNIEEFLEVNVGHYILLPQIVREVHSRGKRIDSEARSEA
jgi:plasmid stabilization system protein ParE